LVSVMKKELRHRIYGTTIEQWISLVPGELPIDAVGLWQIVPAGRDGFGLAGDELVEFVKANILALLAKGAKPVIGAMDNVHFWTLVSYGETPEQIADAIIHEWRSSGREPSPGDVWFALPHIYGAKRTHNAPEGEADPAKDVRH
jgi:hypothetical protein